MSTSPRLSDPTPSALPSGPSAGAGARAWLRERTRDAHDRVDGAPVMAALMDGRMSPMGYRALLAALHRLHVRFEQDHAVFFRHAAARGWPYASRTALLAAEMGDTHGDVAALPSASAPTTAAGWGALYVIEGSTLGARLIAARLCTLFPQMPPSPYFSLGTDDPTHWRRFERILERELADPALHADALAGARATFATFARALEAIDA